MNKIMIYPVIHVLDEKLALEQADIAFDAGADGVFLISHYGKDNDLPAMGEKIKAKYPDKKVGLNFLALGPVNAYLAARQSGLDMAWGDNCGVDSSGANHLAYALRNLVAEGTVEVFASVAFKYQPVDSKPDVAATNAFRCGFIPTTSGDATGSAPSVDKIAFMSEAVGGKLAVASGMTAENIQRFAPYLSHVLVATGVSEDEHRFDYELLHQFIALAKK